MRREVRHRTRPTGAGSDLEPSGNAALLATCLAVPGVSWSKGGLAPDSKGVSTWLAQKTQTFSSAVDRFLAKA